MQSEEEMIKMWRLSLPGGQPEANWITGYRDEVIRADEAYTDGELMRVSAAGFNAIWLGADFSRLATTAIFPEFAPDAELHMKSLNRLIERAARHKLKIFLLLQLPAALPVESTFWSDNPHLQHAQEEVCRGARGQEYRVRCLCSSMPQIKRYLYQLGADLAAKAPELGGIILQTVADTPTHCWSWRGQKVDADEGIAVTRSKCPSCGSRTAAAVVSEIIRLVREGIRSSSDACKIIVWNRGWDFYEPIPSPGIISALPRDVILMLDWDYGRRRKSGRREITVIENSMTSAAPSEACIAALETAAAVGLEVMVKLQIGTSQELTTVPNLPVIPVLWEQVRFIRQFSLSGYMGCWDYGNMLSANTHAFNWFLRDDAEEDGERELAIFAHDYFPKCSAKGMLAGWQKLIDALECYPATVDFIKFGPVNFPFILPWISGPLLSGKVVGRSWVQEERGDELNMALKSMGLDDIIAQLEKVCVLWDEGVVLLEGATALCHHLRVTAEMNSVKVSGLAFHSALNFCKVYRLRRSWRSEMMTEYRQLAFNEVQILRQVLPLLDSDPRMGYHSGAGGYLYDAAGVRQQLAGLLHQLA